MWEMLGFTDSNAGIPNNDRYYKNIIPEDYTIYDRIGVDSLTVIEDHPAGGLIDIIFGFGKIVGGKNVTY